MDIEAYLKEMERAKTMASDAMRIAQQGIATKDRMKKLSSNVEDPDVALGAKQEDALFVGQLALTEKIDAPLAAAKAALS